MALNRSSKWLCRCAVFALCFALRLGVGAAIDASVPVIKRADVYSDIAANLTRGHGFVAEPGGAPIVWRAPLYPAFLAVLYHLFGEHNETAVFIAQTVLDSITAVLIFWIGTHLFGASVGFFSAVAFALHPLSAYYSLRFLSEPLLTVTFTATIAAWMWAIRTQRPMMFLAVGVLIAISALVKPVALGLWPCLAACAWYRLRNDIRRAGIAVASMTLACLLVLTPWALRNYQVTGKLLPVAVGGGYTLWLGNQLVSDGHEDWEVDSTVRERLFALRNTVFETAGVSDRRVVSSSSSGQLRSFVEPVNFTLEDDRAFLRAAWLEIASHPFGSAVLVIKKFFRFWFGIFLPDNRWAQSYIVIFQTAFLSFAVLGIMEAHRRGEILFPLLLPVVFLTVAHVLTFATIRYSIPTLPAMTIFMLSGLREAVRALNERFGISLGVSFLRSLQAIPLNRTELWYRRRRP